MAFVFLGMMCSYMSSVGTHFGEISMTMGALEYFWFPPFLANVLAFPRHGLVIEIIIRHRGGGSFGIW